MRLTVFLLAAVLAPAAEFRVSAGVSDFQVFQRNAQNVAAIKIGGIADGLKGKSIDARILLGGKVLKGWSWKPIANVQGATWTGVLTDVPTGGPYSIQFRAEGSIPTVFKNILVGDLWIVAGQSSIEGQRPDSTVHIFDSRNGWGAGRTNHSGPGLPVALETVRRTGVPVGLIPRENRAGDMANGGSVAGVIW